MAQEMMDIRLDDNGDLQIANDDFMIAESTDEHQRQLLLNTKGDFKENPTICVGAFRFVDDEQHYRLMREIHVEFSRDGMNVKRVNIESDGIIKTDAGYEQ